MKERKRTRALGWLLTLAMVFSMLPTAALAAEDSEQSYGAEAQADTDRNPTTEELAELGYSFAEEYQVTITEGRNLWLNGEIINESQKITILEHISASDSKKHKAIFMSMKSGNVLKIGPQWIAEDKTNNPTFTELKGGGFDATNLQVDCPQSPSDLHVDTNGRIYYIFYPVVGDDKAPKTYYLGAEGFTTETDGLPVLPVTVTLVAGQNSSITSGNAAQTLRIGESIAAVTVTPSADFIMPDTWAGNTSGLTYRQNNGGASATISGAPSAGGTFTLPAAVSNVWNIALTAGSGMETSGSLTQKITKGQAISPITITPAQGQELIVDTTKAPWKALADAGLTVEKDSATGIITVKGVPTADVTGFRIPDATPAPYGVTKVPADRGAIAGGDSAIYNTDYTATLTPKEGFQVAGLTAETAKDVITVTVNGQAYTGFTYDPATNQVTIPGGDILGDISISVKDKAFAITHQTGVDSADGTGYIQAAVAPDTKYAVVDKNGAPIAGVSAYYKDAQGVEHELGTGGDWVTTDPANGPIYFAPIPAGSEAVLVSKPSASDATVAQAKDSGTAVKLPVVSPEQITGRVEPDGGDEGELADAYITVKPTDPDMSYAVVDGTGKVIGGAEGWKDGSANSALDFGPLDPGTRYEVVAVPKNTESKPAEGMADKGTAITTPGVKGSADKEAAGTKVEPGAITRENDEGTGKDTITLAGEKTRTDLEYAVVDPVTGEVVKDGQGNPIWKSGTAEENRDLVFGGLEPNKKYEVVTRPAVTDGSIAVAARPGALVEKVGVLKATGRVVFWPDGTKDSEVGVAGATVRVTVSTIDGGYENLKVTSDAEGYFTFEGSNIKLPATYTVYADSNDIAKGVYTQQDAFTSVQPQTLRDIRVLANKPTEARPNTNVTGGAVSDHGKPVAGDSAHKIVVRDKQTGEVVANVPGTLQPTASGGYTAGNFPDGTYILEFTTGDGKTGMTEIKVDKNVIAPNATGGYTNTNIPVNKGGIVTGFVDGLAAGETATISMNVPIYDAQGNIIGTKTVTGVAEGEGGYWQIAGVPDGSYPVTVTTPKGTITGAIDVEGGKVTAAADGEGTPDGSLTPGTGERDGKVLVTVPGGKPAKPNVITGAVVDKDNVPVKGATVTIYNEKGEKVGEAVTGEGGGYTVPNDLPAGKYYVSADEGGRNGLTGPIEIKADGTTKGKTSVAVSDAASKLLEGAVTKADGTTKAAGATVTVKDGAGNVIATTKTDANGQYYVGGVPAGATVSIVTPDGESASFPVSGSTAWNGDQTTARPAAGAKPVIGPDGSKLPIQMGAAGEGKAGIAITNTAGEDAGGKFQIVDGNIAAKDGADAPAPGAYTVTVTDNHGMAVKQTITVNAEGAISNSTPITIKAHTVSGTVQYETGKIPAAATVTVPGWGSAKVNTTTGKYELSGIPDGSYSAKITVVDSEDGSTNEVTVTLKVENGVAAYTPGAGADVAPGSTDLTVLPTDAVKGISQAVTAARDAIASVPADKEDPAYGDALDAAIAAVKDAQDAINGASEEQLKQINPGASQELADALVKLLEGKLSVTAKAEGMSNASDASETLNGQKGLLVDNGELIAAREPGKTVEVFLNLKADHVTDEPTSSVNKDMPKVEAVASAVGAKGAALYEIVVEKTTVVKEADVEVDTTVSTVAKLPTPITITLAIPENLRGYDYYAVLRVHGDSAAERIPSTTDKTTVTFASNLYSTYAILASNDPMFDDDVAADDGNQGGDYTGGGTSATTVKVDKAENGSVKVDRPSAGKGQTVTITITPEPGFELDTLAVKDKNGNNLEVKDLGNGKYSFVMPDAQPVTVTATFKETGATGNPHTNGVAGLLIVDDHIAFLQGDDQGNFRPTGNITRAETAQLFYNLLKDKNVTGGKAFSDVSADAWYAAAVNALANLGIVEGVGEGRYEPERAISRAEFVAMAMRFATNVTGTRTFSDVAEGYWAHGYITGAAYYGWINGYEDGTFRPANPIARAEAATVVNRMLAREGDKSHIDTAEELKRFPDVAGDYWAFYEIAEATNAHGFTRDDDGMEHWTK